MSHYWNLTILADLGNQKSSLAERPLVYLDPDKLGEGIAALTPSISLRLPDPLQKKGGEINIELKVTDLEDLEPEGLLKKAPHLRDLATLLGELQSLSRSVGRGDVKEEIERLQKALQMGLDDLLQHPRFMAFEGALRGIERLVRRSHHQKAVRISILSANPQELVADLCSEDGPARSMIGERLYFNALLEEGEATDLLVMGNQIGGDTQEMHLLHGLMGLGAWAQLPVVIGAKPSLLGLRRWSALDRITNPAMHQRQQLPKLLQGLQSQVASRYIAATVPPYLSRYLYRDEDIDGLGVTYSEGTHRGKGAMNPQSSGAFLLAELILQDPLIATAKPNRKLGRMPVAIDGLISDFNGSGRLKQSVGPFPFPASDRLTRTLGQMGFSAFGGALAQPKALLFSQNTLCQVQADDGENAMAIRLAQRLSSTLTLSRWGRRLQQLALKVPDVLSAHADVETWLREQLEGDSEALVDGARVLKVSVQIPPEPEAGGLTVQLGLQLDLGGNTPLWLAGPVWLPMVLG